MKFEDFQAIMAIIQLTPTQLAVINTANASGAFLGNDIPGCPGKYDVNLAVLKQYIAKAQATT